MAWGSVSLLAECSPGLPEESTGSSTPCVEQAEGSSVLEMDPGLLKGHCKWTRELAFILESGESPQSHHTAASTVVWDILIGSLPGEKFGSSGGAFCPGGPNRQAGLCCSLLPNLAPPWLLSWMVAARLDEGSGHRTV